MVSPAMGTAYFYKLVRCHDAESGKDLSPKHVGRCCKGPNLSQYSVSQFVAVARCIRSERVGRGGGGRVEPSSE
jgi:hypothetical protein